jgi:hypothetical protein
LSAIFNFSASYSGVGVASGVWVAVGVGVGDGCSVSEGNTVGGITCAVAGKQDDKASIIMIAIQRLRDIFPSSKEVFIL